MRPKCAIFGPPCMYFTFRADDSARCGAPCMGAQLDIVSLFVNRFLCGFRLFLAMKWACERCVSFWNLMLDVVKICVKVRISSKTFQNADQTICARDFYDCIECRMKLPLHFYRHTSVKVYASRNFWLAYSVVTPFSKICTRMPIFGT